MAVMEYLNPETYRMLDYSDTGLMAEIRRAVMVLHDGGFVHGDIRDLNVMTRHHRGTGEDARNVFLLDFDWARRDGVAKCPPNVNVTSVRRPEGARDGALIMKEQGLIISLCSHCFCIRSACSWGLGGCVEVIWLLLGYEFSDCSRVGSTEKVNISISIPPFTRPPTHTVQMKERCWRLSRMRTVSNIYLFTPGLS
jgi:serine/threonine protein kinase